MNNRHLTTTTGPVPVGADLSGKAKERGITLIELMVVLVVIGLGALVVLDNMNSMYRKYELEASSHSLSTFIDSVPAVAKEQNAPIFMTWDPPNNQVTLAVSAGGVMTTVDQMEIPDYLVVNPSSAETYRCDTLGRAFSGNDTTMLSAPEVITITHDTMLDGRVKPGITFTLSLSPLWHVTTVKSLS
jgi:prepilin-type N-terminal cleavage/methylation domain-containing protein